MLKKIKKNKEKLVLIFIFLLAFFLRVYKLDEIPGELWGDVNEHIIFAKNILAGYIHFGWGGDGPIFDYLSALFFLFFGKNFLVMKLVTVFIGLLSIILTYIIVKKINQEKYIHYLTVFLLSTSFLHISFSRQAKPYILVLLFVELFVFFYLKRKHFISGFILGLGLFTQSSFWGMSFFSLLNWRTLIGFLPFFIFLFAKQIYPEILLSQTSYLGEKIGHQLDFSQKIYNFLGNIFDNFQSIFLKGDIGFRHNIPERPILDFSLTIFFIIGLIIFFRKIILNEKERKTALFLFFVFIFSQFASFLDVSNPQNSPNFGRMIGAAFFIYYLCSLGIFYFYKKINSIPKEKMYLKIGFFLLFLFIFIKNFYDYFFIYPKTLPNKNVPYGKIITDDIKNEFDNFKEIIIFGCCWGEWGQPEPKSYFNYLEDKIKINYFDFSEEDKLCDFIKRKKQKILIYTSNSININCFENFKIKKVKKDFYQKLLIN